MPIGANHASQKDEDKVEFLGRDFSVPMDDESILDCNYQKGLKLPYTEFITAVHDCCYPVGMVVRYKSQRYIIDRKVVGVIRRQR